ncbi:DUF4254 domain-containing protein [Nocardia sp. NRRL S-836]|uniref:DUF4254 domain-containing protein n=1 Tax=Nocardia sp. NRRL S-836 TaxID=1519492 RepID=UPI0006AEE5F2|nr:DUF4254 domain-containing protein [Nocardia sp. NRRL S-836]
MRDGTDGGWRIPTGAELLASLGSGSVPADSTSSRFLECAHRLLRHHREQWHSEDEVRRCYGDDGVVAALKRKIDAMNAARVPLVEDVDDLVAGHVPPPADVTPMHTETLGSVVDRLTIAFIRAEVFRASRPGHARQLLAEQQLDELAHAYDDLVHELAAGTRRVPAWRVLKAYGNSC